MKNIQKQIRNFRNRFENVQEKLKQDLALPVLKYGIFLLKN